MAIIFQCLRASVSALLATLATDETDAGRQWPAILTAALPERRKHG